jgi:hypothetical protein
MTSVRSGIRSVESADIFREALELCLRQFVASGCSEKSWECPLEDQAISDIRRNFLPLKGRSIHELQFFSPCKPKKLGQSLQNPDISRGRINASLNLAPVARVETDLFTEVSKGQLFLNSQGFGKFVKHDGVMGCGRILPHDDCVSISLDSSDGGDPPNSQQTRLLKVFSLPLTQPHAS